MKDAIRMKNIAKVNCDYAVIGGGVVGLCTALELRDRHPSSKIILIEKEQALGMHASTRNSGVLHAGFYYTEDSLKARFCKDGNEYWTQFCERHHLRINKCGKLVVAIDETQLKSIDLLHQRANKNGVKTVILTKREAKAINPSIKTHEKALYSPDTSSIDPFEIMSVLERLAREQNIEIFTQMRVEALNADHLLTNRGVIEAGYVFNCAGLYSDQIARQLNLADEYRVLPFKGIYLKTTSPSEKHKTHVYPVPDLNYPFLGVHITSTVDGKVKLGPTAIPAFWREQYKGFENFDLKEALEISLRHLALIVTDDGALRKLAFNEMLKFFKSEMFKQANQLVEGIDRCDFDGWTQPGIRAQLVNVKTKKLEMDFVIRKNKNSLHVLNAVSPGFTCAVPFAKYICEQSGV